MPSRRALFSEGFSSLVSRRILVVDQGTKFLKVLAAESSWGRMQVLHRQCINLAEEGLSGPDEIHEHLEKMLPPLGEHSLAVVVPQHRCITQIVELPQGSRADLAKTAETEAARLLGLADTALQFDWAELKPFGSYAKPCLLTVCRASEVHEQIDRLHDLGAGASGEGLGEKPFEEITCGGQALFAAAQHALPAGLNHAMLVDLGAGSTSLALVFGGQLVFATTLPIGAQQFTDVLARALGCSVADAETRKMTVDLLQGAGAVPQLADSVQHWFSQVRQTVAEWLEDHPELELKPGEFSIHLAGGGALQPGLVPYLNGLGVAEVVVWSSPIEGGQDWPFAQYWLAYGLALQCFGRTFPALSLLPGPHRLERSKGRLWRYLQTSILVVMAIVTLLLVFGTWQKVRVSSQKRALRQQAEATLDAVRRMDLLSRRLAVESARINPVLTRQRQTMETLQALDLVRRSRTNRECWYILFGDSVSYASGTTMPLAGAMTNPPSAGTNNPMGGFRREFIAELCIPQIGDETRKVLNLVVNDLQKSSFFSKVDALPPERKRNLVDPRTYISNQVFAVAMELAGYENLPWTPAFSERFRGPGGPRDGRGGRPTFRARPERGGPAVTNR